MAITCGWDDPSGDWRQESIGRLGRFAVRERGPDRANGALVPHGKTAEVPYSRGWDCSPGWGCFPSCRAAPAGGCWPFGLAIWVGRAPLSEKISERLIDISRVSDILML